MSWITKRKYVHQEVLDFVEPTEKQQIVQITGPRGNNLHSCINAQGETFLVSMPNKFRKSVYVKRGGYVIIDPIEEGDKVRGEITNVLLKDAIHHLQDRGLWPEVFQFEQRKATSYIEDDLLPPSDSGDEDDDHLGFKVYNANKGHVNLYEEEDDDDEEDSEKEEEEKKGEERKEDEEEGECKEEEEDKKDGHIEVGSGATKDHGHKDSVCRSGANNEVDDLAEGLDNLKTS